MGIKGALARSGKTKGSRRGANVCAQKLGSLGGKVGGKARSRSLSPVSRSKIASQGGHARARALTSSQKRHIAERARKSKRK